MGPVVPGSPVLPSGESAAAPRQDGMVGHGHIKPKQSEHAEVERLRLAQGQVEDEP